MSTWDVMITLSVVVVLFSGIRLEMRVRRLELAVASLLPQFSPGEPPRSMIVYESMSDEPVQHIYTRNGERWHTPKDAA